MLILKGFKNFPKLHIRTRTDTMRKSAHIRANLNAYAHICRHTRTHAHIRTRMSTYAHIRTHAHAYARVRTQTHTYAHICAHMQNAGERSMSQVSEFAFHAVRLIEIYLVLLFFRGRRQRAQPFQIRRPRSRRVGFNRYIV